MGNRLTRKRILLKANSVLVAIFALAACSDSNAQATAASVWVKAPQQPENGPDTYVHRTYGDQVMLLDFPIASSAGIEPMMQTLEKACVGISSARPHTVSGGKLLLQTSTQGKAHCTFGVFESAKTGAAGARGVFIMKMPALAVSTEEMAANWAGQYMGGGANGATAAATPAKPSTGSIAPAGNLAAALAQVPQAHRPIAMVLRNEYKVSGLTGYTSYLPWMVFANGYATDSDCYEWDPAMVAPTPQAMAAAGLDCDVVRWRKAGNRYQFQDEDGAWDDPEFETPLYPGRRGQSFELEMENVGGASAGARTVGTGAVQVNTLWSGSLKMTKSGEISVGDWSGAVISGEMVGGGSGRSTSVTGRYYIDGYLIAIADDKGGVRRGFFAAADTDGKLANIYLNGEQYWFPDT